jgi:hypothetical protein
MNEGQSRFGNFAGPGTYRVGLADRPFPSGRWSSARQVCREGLCASLGLHSAAF